MPLHQINVSPAESVKNEAFSDRQGVGGRCESQLSSESSGSQGVEICRICHCEGDADAGLIAPCYCAGSLRFVHQLCLQQWIKSSNTKSCELCRFQFIMHTKTKPFTEWEPLEMNGFERRKLVCAVMFHAVALTCVVWSLYVLIDRTAEEIRQGLLEWPFWTKLIVVAIGFTGGVVFMYIQCKAYMQVCQRWKAYNRVIYVQNAPEKQGSVSVGGGGVVGTRRECDCSAAEQASIDLTGVRNVHIYFKDEVEAGGEVGGAGPAPTLSTATSAPPSSDPTWHIKIGKAPISSDSTPAIRNSEAENGGCGIDSREDSLARSPADPSLLKLQIKKAEIVIQFGQKGSTATVATESCGEMGPAAPDKDTSVNIKIDDKESEPIVIDLVKKGTAPLDGAEIRLGFGGAEDSLRGVTLVDVPEEEPRPAAQEDVLLEHCGGGSVAEADGLLERHPTPDYHSGTDSGSQSPLLQTKNLD